MSRLDYNINWDTHFKLDSKSPSGLVKIKDKYGKDIDPVIIGTPIEKAENLTYWIVKFKNKGYQVHRIIWAMTYGSIDSELFIDHLDGNGLNNSIGNLSLKTPAGNSRNKRQQVNSKTGIAGVVLADSGKGHQYYLAHWYEIDGSLKRKYFSILKFGEVGAKLAAISYRETQIAKLISQGANYTQRHGHKLNPEPAPQQ